MNYKLDRFDVKRIPHYQKGAEGFFAFIEENVRFRVVDSRTQVVNWMYPTELSDEPHPETGKTWKGMWESQKRELRPALVMKNGRFRYKVIVLCWPRGEGKSFMVVLLQLWKFFCFPRQLIVFGALSKDQTKFVHYEISKDLIYNSPKLVSVIGKDNVQQGKLILKNSKGEVNGSIQPISTMSGIVSNITGYTFSEMFDMKDHKFFVQLDGSTRNIINALGTIDSTVSTKDHILYQLYRGFRDGSDKLIYFSYRSAPNATPDEYWNPEMTDDELKSRQARYPKAEFDRYFRNSWELESGKLFTVPMVKGIFNIGYYDEYNMYYPDDGGVLEICNEIQEVEVKAENRDGSKNKTARRRKRKTKYVQLAKTRETLNALYQRLVPVKRVYQLSHQTLPKLASNKDLQKLSDLYDTNWSIHVGLDRSDPLTQSPNARTILTAVAKGLPGSRSNPHIMSSERDIPNFIYFLLHLAHIEDASLEGIKRETKSVFVEFDGIDTFCTERWGAWDFGVWCDELDINFEAIYPSFPVQKKIFNNLFLLVRNGKFKSPDIYVPGVEDSNILKEELEMFDYNPAKKDYGSPQKDKQGGVQDDAVFSLGISIYGSRDYDVDDFRERISNPMFGLYVPGKPKTGEEIMGSF